MQDQKRRQRCVWIWLGCFGWISTGLVWGQTTSGPVLREAVVRTRSVGQVCALGVKCGQRVHWGSGTVIGKWRSRWAVLTCYHTLFREGRHTVDAGGGPGYAAELIAAEPGWDLAVLVFEAPHWGCVSLGTEIPETQADVETAAFPEGREYRSRIAHYVGTWGNRGDLLIDTELQGGESGGGLFAQGRLVGVLWGTDARAGQSLAVSLVRIREFLQRRNVQIEPCTPAAIPQPPANNPPTSPSEPSVLRDQVKQLQARLELWERQGERELTLLKQELAEVKLRAAVPGPRGETGPRGEAGPQGARGPPGGDADVTVIRGELSALKEAFRKLEASLIVEVTPLP